MSDQQRRRAKRASGTRRASRRTHVANPWIGASVFVFALGCGGSSEPDPILEQELAAEESQGEETEAEHELHENERRVHASQSLVFAACYENPDAFPPHAREHRARIGRQFRERMIQQPHMDDSDTADSTNVAVDLEETQDAPPPAGPASEHADEVTRLEAELDAIHAETGADPDYASWSVEEVARYEDLSQDLAHRCERWAAEASAG